MVNEYYNSIVLSGNKDQITHFIEHHSSTQNDLLIWDCSKSLEDKLKKDKISEYDYNHLENNFGGYLDRNNDYIFITSKRFDISKAIILLSKFYDKLTINMEYFDEYSEDNYGWLYIKNGEVINSDQINLHNHYYPEISNQLTLTGDKEEIKIFLKNKIEHKFINFDYQTKVDKHQPKFGNQLIIENYNKKTILFFNTFKKPCLKWLTEIFNLYPKIEFCLRFKDINDVFYGYLICNNDKIIDDKFIILEKFNYDGTRNLFKYENFDEYFNSNYQL
jgi:hypothetical protein